MIRLENKVTGVQLEQTFLIPVPVEDAWEVLLDIEQVASCMPGAALDSVAGDEFTGRVKVKLGPINLTYAGKATFVEKDETDHRVVMHAQGKDRRGNSTASAVITAQLTADSGATRVDVRTDLSVTGRPAQFGRGAMNDVADKLLAQFADQLTRRLTTAPDTIIAAGPTASTAASASAPTTPGPDLGAVSMSGAHVAGAPEPIDLMKIVGGSLNDRLRRQAAAGLGVLVFAVIATLLRRRRR